MSRNFVLIEVLKELEKEGILDGKSAKDAIDKLIERQLIEDRQLLKDILQGKGKINSVVNGRRNYEQQTDCA